MKEVQLWLQKSEEDFSTAELMMKNKKYSYAAFLLQQSIEKGLKAILLNKKMGLIKTHDCRFLAIQVQAPENILSKAERISVYYIRNRYPDVVSKDTFKEEVIILFDEAKEVLQWIQKNL